MSRLTRDGTAETVSRDQILRHERGQGNTNFPCSADHKQDWQPYPVDPYSAICVTIQTIHTYTTVTENTAVLSYLSEPRTEVAKTERNQKVRQDKTGTQHCTYSSRICTVCPVFVRYGYLYLGETKSTAR